MPHLFAVLLSCFPSRCVTPYASHFAAAELVTWMVENFSGMLWREIFVTIVTRVADYVYDVQSTVMLRGMQRKLNFQTFL